jgi:hypothetical protein
VIQRYSFLSNGAGFAVKALQVAARPAAMVIAIARRAVRIAVAGENC